MDSRLRDEYRCSRQEGPSGVGSMTRRVLLPVLRLLGWRDPPSNAEIHAWLADRRRQRRTPSGDEQGSLALRPDLHKVCQVL